jgi:citrate synthase
LHGGAPGPALDLVFEIGRAERAEQVLREKLARGERLMGFGHRIYRTRDPRADVLGAAAEHLLERTGSRRVLDLARAVESCALRLLREYKPGRSLQTNVEFYTALLLHGLGFPTSLFTPVFAAGRVAGWTAHCLEQLASNRLFRPQSQYVGVRNRVPIAAADRDPDPRQVSE